VTVKTSYSSVAILLCLAACTKPAVVAQQTESEDSRYEFNNEQVKGTSAVGASAATGSNTAVRGSTASMPTASPVDNDIVSISPLLPKPPKPKKPHP
jgi:hypothetical protein